MSNQLEIPPAVREQVEDRDQGTCRMCGSWTGEQGALHHVKYRSEGGLHVVENLVTVHWMYWPRCHERAHSNKGLWQPILLEVVKHPGISAFQLRRWASGSRAVGRCRPGAE